jgi:hypothetical protein
MKICILILTLFFILCTPAVSAEWVKFSNKGEDPLYYDRGSSSCFKSFDRSSGITTGYSAKVWIKAADLKVSSTETNTTLWSLNCTGRKIDREGHDNPDIYGKDIRPDSLEEKLYNIICPRCRNLKYER